MLSNETYEEMQARHDREERSFARFIRVLCIAGLCVAVSIAVGVMIELVGWHRVTGRGEFVGVVTDFGQYGRWWPTWELRAIAGSREIPGTGTTERLSVWKDGPIEDVRAAMLSGQKVRIAYEKVWAAGVATAETDYRVTGVRPAEER